MPESDDAHISPEKLHAIAANKAELSRREFEHIHVCPDCLQAYAEAIRQRARNGKTKPPNTEQQRKKTDLIFQFI
jgi:hypothetical protein